jgi:5-formyltetrahydrofolate cyclo-ligase
MSIRSTSESSSAPSVETQKKELRRLFQSRIAALAFDYRQSEEQALRDHFVALPGIKEASRVLLYVSAFPEEWTTRELFNMVRELGKETFCPRVDRRRRCLTLHRVVDPSRDLQPGVFGIPEPRRGLPESRVVDIDWALVPGLAFDERGYRLGRGGGYYDRLLTTLRSDTVCWALGFECQLVGQLPIESFDQPLSGVTTPSRQVRGARPLSPFEFRPQAG